MIIKWIYPESEEILGIKRNKGDSFEIDDNIGKQLISQGKGQLSAQDRQGNDVVTKKSEKSKVKGEK